MSQTTQSLFHEKRLRQHGTFSLTRQRPGQMSVYIQSINTLGTREEETFKLKSKTGIRTKVYKLVISKCILGIKIAFLTISRLKFWNSHPSRKGAGITELMGFIFIRRYTATCHRTQEVLCSPCVPTLIKVNTVKNTQEGTVWAPKLQ